MIRTCLTPDWQPVMEEKECTFAEEFKNIPDTYTRLWVAQEICTQVMACSSRLTAIIWLPLADEDLHWILVGIRKAWFVNEDVPGISYQRDVDQIPAALAKGGNEWAKEIRRAMPDYQVSAWHINVPVAST